MHKIGHIVCIMSIVYLQDHLTMPDILVGLLRLTVRLNVKPKCGNNSS